MQQFLARVCTAALIVFAGLPSATQADVIVGDLGGGVPGAGSLRRFANPVTAPVNQLPSAERPPVATGLTVPSALVFGPDGFIYAAMNASLVGAPNDFIARINPANGSMTDVKDLGNYGPGGLAFAPGSTAANGTLYLTKGTGPNNTQFGLDVLTVANGSVTNQTSLPVALSHPSGITFGPDGNLYIANSGINSQVASDGTIARYNPTTQAFDPAFVPNNSGGLGQPVAVAFNAAGNLFVADDSVSNANGGAVRRYSATGASLGDFIPGGLASPLQFQFPSSLLFDGNGHLLVANLSGTFSNADVMVFDDTVPNTLYGNLEATKLGGAGPLLLVPVPEPGTLVLCGAVGLTGIVVRSRRAKR